METVTKMGPCGGGGGTNRDMDVRAVNRIVRVLVRHGYAIDAISCQYERDGVQEQTEDWGGTGGALSEIRLGPDEYLTGVKGHIGSFMFVTCLKSLTLVSNLRSYGPFGKEDGMEFTLSAPPGGRIIGFHGRSWWLLDAIGIYVKAWNLPPQKTKKDGERS
ncbi:hypothetical protein ZWY2020_000880 [Hordeum vulgare]|nr:hypothetical protein ZWY2020_000880 [Hordeum vulgare]